MLKVFVLLMSLLTIPLSQSSPDVEASYINGYNFSVREVQRYCKAKRVNSESLSIQCKESRLRPVAQSCEGWISGGLDFAEFRCSGGLWILNKVCKIEMIGASRGNVNCVF